MSDQNIQQKIDIRQLTTQSSRELIKHSYFAGSEILNQGIGISIFQSIKRLPHATRLVAYDIEKEKAIGFICLE